MDFSIEIIGTIGAILTTASFVPQVYKLYKNKSVEAISLTMYLVFLVGLIFWLIYGISIGSFSIIFANTITGILVLIILVLKIVYGKKSDLN